MDVPHHYVDTNNPNRSVNGKIICLDLEEINMTLLETLKAIHAMNAKFLETYTGRAEIIALLNNVNALIENTMKENG